MGIKCGGENFLKKVFSPAPPFSKTFGTRGNYIWKQPARDVDIVDRRSNALFAIYIIVAAHQILFKVLWRGV
jgi:hypothetical protein